MVTGDDEGIFGVDAQFLYALKPLDREKQPSYSLQVTYSTTSNLLNSSFIKTAPSYDLIIFKNLLWIIHFQSLTGRPSSSVRVGVTLCVCVCYAGVFQDISAPAELHRGSVRHWQEWQCAHFHTWEHERQRSAGASQRFENLELWCHCVVTYCSGNCTSLQMSE